VSDDLWTITRFSPCSDSLVWHVRIPILPAKKPETIWYSRDSWQHPGSDGSSLIVSLLSRPT
jgi:hypothetical protein